LEPDWGCRFRWPAKGRERAYAGLQRIRKTLLRVKCTKNQTTKYLIFVLIKDYAADMSKRIEKKPSKAGK
jgi:hypothetical protein